MDTATFSWWTCPSGARRSVFRQGAKSVVLIKPVPGIGCQKFRPGLCFNLVTSPTQIPLNISMAVDVNLDFSAQLVVKNHLDDDLVVDFDVESNFFCEPFAQPGGITAYDIIGFTGEEIVHIVDEEMSEEDGWSLVSEDSPFPLKPTLPMPSKRFTRVKIPSKGTAVLDSVDWPWTGPFFFTVGITLDAAIVKSITSRLQVENLLKGGAEKDLVIVCRPDKFTPGYGLEKRFEVHSAIMSCRSDYFKALLLHGMTEAMSGEVVISDISCNALAEIIHFIYTNEVKNLDDVGCELLAAADKLLLVVLKNKVERFLTENLRLSSILEVLDSADRHDCPALFEAATKFFMKHFYVVMFEPKWPDFVSERPELLTKLLMKLPIYYVYQGHGDV